MINPVLHRIADGHPHQIINGISHPMAIHIRSSMASLTRWPSTSDHQWHHSPDGHPHQHINRYLVPTQSCIGLPSTSAQLSIVTDLLHVRWQTDAAMLCWVDRSL